MVPHPHPDGMVGHGVSAQRPRSAPASAGCSRPLGQKSLLAGGRRRHSSLTRPRDLPRRNTRQHSVTTVHNHSVTRPNTLKGSVVRGVDGPGLDHELAIGVAGNPEITHSGSSFHDPVKLSFLSSVLIWDELQCLVVSETGRMERVIQLVGHTLNIVEITRYINSRGAPSFFKVNVKFVTSFLSIVVAQRRIPWCSSVRNSP
jgi:hypothetical protein